MIPSVTDTQFERFGSLIYRECGIRLNDRKRTIFSSRLRRRLQATGVDDVENYFRLVTSPTGRTELEALIDTITTNETSFYRTDSHFQWFSDEFLPAFRRSRRSSGPKRLRLWSAACATGAEAYTMAFCVAAQRMYFSGWDIEIHASDISESSLDSARRGQFRRRVLENVPPAVRNRCFEPPEGDVYVVRPEYRKMVSFSRHNLLNRWPGEAMDCIFLRNVLIYFDQKSKQKVLDHVVSALRPGGFLVTGPSEGIFGMDNPLEKLTTCVYRKSLSDPASIDDTKI